MSLKSKYTISKLKIYAAFCVKLYKIDVEIGKGQTVKYCLLTTVISGLGEFLSCSRLKNFGVKFIAFRTKMLLKLGPLLHLGPNVITGTL